MITVVAVTTQRIPEHLNAIYRTLDVLPVDAKGLLISPSRPETNIEWRPMCGWEPGIKGLHRLNRFLLHDLIDFIDTEFALTVHWDGFAIRREMWHDAFLDYDYIGAPWPWWVRLMAAQYGGKGVVGNGGFSLRSRKYMQCTRALVQTVGMNGEPEDAFACRKHRELLQKMGVRFAPLSIAQRFSWEHHTLGASLDHSFGFHGLSAMKRLCLLRPIEANMF